MTSKFPLAGGWYLQRVEMEDGHHWVICDPYGDRLGDTTKHRAELDEVLSCTPAVTTLDIVNDAIKKVAAPTVRERAAGLAEDANECCNRSDGWEEDMAKLAYTQLSEVVEECAQIAEAYWLMVKAHEEAHVRNSPTPFRLGDYGIDRGIAQRSKEIAMRIRALAHEPSLQADGAIK